MQERANELGCLVGRAANLIGGVRASPWCPVNCYALSKVYGARAADTLAYRVMRQAVTCGLSAQAGRHVRVAGIDRGGQARVSQAFLASSVDHLAWFEFRVAEEVDG